MCYGAHRHCGHIRAPCFMGGYNYQICQKSCKAEAMLEKAEESTKFFSCSREASPGAWRKTTARGNTCSWKGKRDSCVFISSLARRNPSDSIKCNQSARIEAANSLKYNKNCQKKSQRRKCISARETTRRSCWSIWIHCCTEGLRGKGGTRER